MVQVYIVRVCRLTRCKTYIWIMQLNFLSCFVSCAVLWLRFRGSRLSPRDKQSPFTVIVRITLALEDKIKYCWKEHHTPRGALLFLLIFTFLHIAGFLILLIVLGIVEILIGPDAKQKLKILARSLAETNLSCALITTGDADVAGPGVRLLKFLAESKIWGSVAVQIMVTSAAIFLANSHELIVWLLDPNRLARTVFCLVGFIQLCRGHESFYHLMALSIMCELLAIPEYIIAFFRIPSRPEWPDRLLNICASTLAILLNGALLIIAWGWERAAGSCYTTGEIQRPDEFVYLTKIVPGSAAIMIFLVLDVIFIIFLFILPNRGNREGTRTWGPFNKQQKIAIGGGIAGEVILTVLLARLIFDLYSVAGPEQMSWGLGQLQAIFTAVFGIILALLKYSFQSCTVGGEEVTRGVCWWKYMKTRSAPMNFS
jgi:hypothetical protein